MFPGSPSRLRPATPLRSLLRLARPDPVLTSGVWLRGCTRPAAIRIRAPDGPRHFLVAEDLGYLLRRCGEVVVRDGERPVSVPAGVLVGWRVLEVVLAAPFLPPPEQIRVLFPSAQFREGVLVVPLGLGSAEEALGLCAAERFRVAGTRIRYLAAKR
jgi:hypothetical protein